MVADEGVDLAGSAGCFLFEPHQEIERLARLRAACRKVAHLHQVRRARYPVFLAIDDSRHPQDRHEGVFVTVDVAYGDDALNSLPVIL